MHFAIKIIDISVWNLYYYEWKQSRYRVLSQYIQNYSKVRDPQVTSRLNFTDKVFYLKYLSWILDQRKTELWIAMNYGAYVKVEIIDHVSNVVMPSSWINYLIFLVEAVISSSNLETKTSSRSFWCIWLRHTRGS